MKKSTVWEKVTPTGGNALLATGGLFGCVPVVAVLRETVRLTAKKSTERVVVERTRPRVIAVLREVVRLTAEKSTERVVVARARPRLTVLWGSVRVPARMSTEPLSSVGAITLSAAPLSAK